MLSSFTFSSLLGLGCGGSDSSSLVRSGKQFSRGDSLPFGLF
jgi:hypothetical protein